MSVDILNAGLTISTVQNGHISANFFFFMWRSFNHLKKNDYTKLRSLLESYKIQL